MIEKMLKGVLVATVFVCSATYYLQMDTVELVILNYAALLYFIFPAMAVAGYVLFRTRNAPTIQITGLVMTFLTLYAFLLISTILHEYEPKGFAYQSMIFKHGVNIYPVIFTLFLRFYFLMLAWYFATLIYSVWKRIAVRTATALRHARLMYGATVLSVFACIGYLVTMIPYWSVRIPSDIVRYHSYEQRNIDAAASQNALSEELRVMKAEQNRKYQDAVNAKLLKEGVVLGPTTTTAE